MIRIRPILSIWNSQETMEGAGVRLKRAFGFSQMSHLDPFLLLDDFHSDLPEDYLAGFPWHPHRGIETVTYMIEGKVKHEDSLGHEGVISPGDVQWMTAGNGIIHQEMPEQEKGKLWGFQLWVNLPASHKRMEPRYQNIPSSRIPVVLLEHGVQMRVISGVVRNTEGPVHGIVVEPLYLDVLLPPNKELVHSLPKDHTAFAYVFEGDGFFDEEESKKITSEQIVLFGPGDAVKIKSGNSGTRLLLVAGKPLKEPIAWQGPVVMNTQAELEEAFAELRRGSFV
jgi:quercetin 2,3-dioxygenase